MACLSELRQSKPKILRLPSLRQYTSAESAKIKRIGVRFFNEDPSFGLKYLFSSGLLMDNASAVAHWLLHEEGLGRGMIGEYLGSPDKFNLAVLEHYVKIQQLHVLPFIQAMREFLSNFRIPGEAQKIERILDVFARHYTTDCPLKEGSEREASSAGGTPRPGVIPNSPDTAHILSYSVLMLNTDLHNNSVKQHMSKEAFIRNNRGIDHGKDLPAEQLESIYDDVSCREFQAKPDNMEAIADVQKRLRGLDESLIAPHRKFILKVTGNSVPDIRKSQPATAHQRTLFLFNDMLLVTRKSWTAEHVVKSSITLRNAHVEPFSTDLYPLGVEVSGRFNSQKLLTFSCEDRFCHRKFVRQLREMVSEAITIERLVATTEGAAERSMNCRISTTSLPNDVKHAVNSPSDAADVSRNPISSVAQPSDSIPEEEPHPSGERGEVPKCQSTPTQPQCQLMRESSLEAVLKTDGYMWGRRSSHDDLSSLPPTENQWTRRGHLGRMSEGFATGVPRMEAVRKLLPHAQFRKHASGPGKLLVSRELSPRDCLSGLARSNALRFTQSTLSRSVPDLLDSIDEPGFDERGPTLLSACDISAASSTCCTPSTERRRHLSAEDLSSPEELPAEGNEDESDNNNEDAEEERCNSDEHSALESTLVHSPASLSSAAETTPSASQESIRDTSSEASVADTCPLAESSPGALREISEDASSVTPLGKCPIHIRTESVEEQTDDEEFSSSQPLQRTLFLQGRDHRVIRQRAFRGKMCNTIRENLRQSMSGSVSDC